MFIEFFYDWTGAFRIGGGNHFGTVGTIEKQHVNYPLLLRTRALHITGLDLESIAAVYIGPNESQFFTAPRTHGR